MRGDRRVRLLVIGLRCEAFAIAESFELPLQCVHALLEHSSAVRRLRRRRRLRWGWWWKHAVRAQHLSNVAACVLRCAPIGRRSRHGEHAQPVTVDLPSNLWVLAAWHDFNAADPGGLELAEGSLQARVRPHDAPPVPILRPDFRELSDAFHVKTGPEGGLPVPAHVRAPEGLSGDFFPQRRRRRSLPGSRSASASAASVTKLARSETWPSGQCMRQR